MASELSRFTVLPTIDGYDVIDETTGRAVDHRDTKLSANGAAQFLNEGVRAGVPLLSARLLRCNPSDPCDPDSIRAWVREPVGVDEPWSARVQSRRELREDL